MTEIEDPLESYRAFPGPVLLLAGPGTGKTFQLAQRVKFLIEQQIATPDIIAVITFTGAAAKNMQDRLGESDIGLDVKNQPHIIATMHSLGNSIIGSALDRLCLAPKYKLLTNHRLRQIVLEDAAFLTTGSRTLFKDTDDCRRCGNCERDASRTKCQVCEKYVQILRKCSVIDYDDQILLACEILERYRDIADMWRAQTRHLLVDEYQDINKAQFRMIQLLSQGQAEGLFVVGDDDQSIYSFRGGTPEYIKNFASDFPGDIRIGRLFKSWRCPEHLLRGAKCIIKAFYPDSFPKPEPNFSDYTEESERISFCDVPSDSWEGKIIARMIGSLGNKDRIIIIIPNANYFPPIRKALRFNGLPYRYKTSLSDDGISRFALLADWAENPHDNLLLRHLAELIIQNHIELVKSLPGGGAGIKEKRIEASNRLATLWNLCGNPMSLYDALTQCSETVADHTFYLELKEQCLDPMLLLINKDGSNRRSLPEFLQRSGLLIAPGRNVRGLMDEIREWRNELSDTGVAATRTPVEIYNMPSSKGLEGDVVFVVGVTENLMPDPKKNLEEQARLFYVAMTRAKRKLYLFSSRSRSASITFRDGSYQMPPSPFVKIIPEDYMDSRQIYPRKKPTVD